MTSISFLGPAGTFSDAALQQILADAPIPALADPGAVTYPAATPHDALQMVRNHECDFALVPTENFVDGPVTTTLDSLARGERLQIFAETEVPVVFSLLVREGTRLEDIREVGSHPVALAQVRQWVDEHLPHVELRVTNSTAGAAEAVQRGEMQAAFAPARAGELLGLTALMSGVADVEGAYTRFVVVGQPGRPPARSGRDRTSVVFRLPNQPATLVNAMNEFGLRGVDLSRIESRPTREKFGTYNFYIDCAGHIEDAAVAETLQALYRRADWLRFLGSWPAYQQVGTPPPDFTPSVEWVQGVRDGTIPSDEN